MRDLDDLRDLKREYVELVRLHGEEAAELEAFKRSLLEMNRRHRDEAVRMYVRIISKVQKKLGRVMQARRTRGRREGQRSR